MSGDVCGLSRRQLLASTALLVGAHAVHGSSLAAETQTPTGVVRHILRRPQDLLVLSFEFRNAAWRKVRGRGRRIMALDATKPLIAIVTFPSQHIEEQAFLETAKHEAPGAVPVWSSVSGPSRLCFDVPATGVTLNPSELLDWAAWTPRLAPAEVAATAVATPGDTVTAIELPTALTISPEPEGRWRHSIRPVTARGRTELWHTRLRTPTDARPNIRAIWTPEYKPDVEAWKQVPAPKPDAILTPLDGRDRDGFIHNTHVIGFDPEPIPVDTLALSAAGGWLAFEKRWKDRPDYPVSWKQRTSLGRDTFVEVEYLAFLYPFGFKVSVAKTTERRVQPSPGSGDAAFLRQHYTIKFEEMERRYDDWALPYTRLVAVNHETPYLDFPTSFPMPGAPNPDWRDGAFWPFVDGRPYEFAFIATDKAGRQTQLNAPLICVPFKRATPDPRLPVIQAEYRQQTARSTRFYLGQQVAFTPESLPLDTSHPTEKITFDGETFTPPAEPVQAPFRPKCAAVQISSSAAKALGGADPDAGGWFNLADPSKTVTEIYLVRQPGSTAMAVSFVGQSDRSGGIAAPSLEAGGFSRITGMFGQQTPDPTKANLVAGPGFAGDQFDPGQFLGSEASILGVKLSTVLEIAKSGAAAAAPKLLSQLNENLDASPELVQTFDWTTDGLKDTPALGILAPIFLTQQGKSGHVAGDIPTRLTLTARAAFDLLGGGPSFEAYGRLSDFAIQLAVNLPSVPGDPNGVVLKFREAWFRARLGEKTKFGIDLISAELTGQILSFVQQLQEAMGPSLSHATRMLDVSPEGVRVSLPPLVLPPLSIGAMDITGLFIASSVSLPFNNRPPTFTFSFSTPTNPFLVAVGIFGGGGYVCLTLDTDGIQSLAAMFQFGGYRALELGPVRGRVFLFGGVSITSARLTDGSPGSTLTLVAFVHAGGEASVFSIVTVGVDFYVSLTYRTGGGTALYGDVRLSYSVKVGFFKRTASVSYSHVLQGSRTANKQVAALGFTGCAAGDRDVNTVADLITRDEWFAYQQAFAK